MFLASHGSLIVESRVLLVRIFISIEFIKLKFFLYFESCTDANIFMLEQFEHFC